MKAWKRISLEAVVIVGSILLAFAIDAWWDERGDRQLRTRTLTGVRADLERNNSRLQQWIGVNRRIVRNGDLLLDRLEAAAPGDPVTVSDTLPAAAVLIPTFDPTRGSVVALIASGNLSLIDEELAR